MRRNGLFIPMVLLGASLHIETATAESNEASDRLREIFKEQWEYSLREYPTFASRLGDRRYNDRWTDVSLKAVERRHEDAKKVLAKLEAIDEASLTPTDRLNLTLFRKDVEQGLEGYPFGWHLAPMDLRGGVQTSFDLADALRFETVKDYEDWIARLRDFPTYVDQNIELMREGAATGRIHPKVILERIPDQIAAQIVDDPTTSPFFKPFSSIPDSLDASDRRRLQNEGRQAVAEYVVPAYQRLAAFFKDDYLPRGYDRVGAWQWPQGDALYAYRARVFTTTNMTPDAIHEIGLREVRRIREEMDAVIKQTGFDGSFEAFLEHLRTDPTFYYTDPQEYLAATRALCKRIDPTLVKLFRRLPRMPYGVEPIPDAIAPDTTTAYYRQPAADGSRGGTYFVNLYKPEVRPKFEMEALAIHEAMPGHHLQIALAMELDDLPEFRRYTGYTAFVEGWGLYSESLGGELGFYQDPYSKFGQLTYEMWRAVRLVVDTGMHAKQWSRQRAIDFFKANAGKTEHDIVNEIDRYIAWPGQALAYKIGELKIKELRARATRELGERFDIRAFHDVVLGRGAVPLDVLEAQVSDWIAHVRAGGDP